MRLTTHPTVPIKVTAWVDEGIAPLVLALNELADVMTLDSCQGDDGRGAYVLFRWQGENVAEFISTLGNALSNQDKLDYLLRAEWRTGSAEPLLELACPAEQVPQLAGSISAFRTRSSSGGNSRTRPRSLRDRLNHRRTVP